MALEIADLLRKLGVVATIQNFVIFAFGTKHVFECRNNIGSFHFPVRSRIE
jgi:hypothetical protein